MEYLVVVSHPDDEVLGAGGTLYNLINKGHNVNVCILSGNVDVRYLRPEIEVLYENIHESLQILGIKNVYIGDFPNIKFNNVDHVELVQYIESIILETKAEVVFTHHPNDLNNDHLQTSLACQAAVRLFQRRDDVPPLKELLFMEILSSTDWSLNKSSTSFNANTFFEIGEEGLNKKIEALSKYQDVMRPYPHPRSVETLRALATYRGSQAGMIFAEGFESALRREEI